MAVTLDEFGGSIANDVALLADDHIQEDWKLGYLSLHSYKQQKTELVFKEYGKHNTDLLIWQDFVLTDQTFVFIGPTVLRNKIQAIKDLHKGDII